MALGIFVTYMNSKFSHLHKTILSSHTEGGSHYIIYTMLLFHMYIYGHLSFTTMYVPKFLLITEEHLATHKLFQLL